MDIVQRLMTYRDYTGLTNSQFADRAGIPRPTLSQFLNGRNKRLSDDMTSKLHLAYPDLNILWLLFGEGEMVNVGNIELSEGNIGQIPGLFGAQSAEKENDSYTPHPADFCSEFDAKEKETPQKTLITDDKPIPAGLKTDMAKKVQYIMVFYTDNSYEMFTPGTEER